MKYKKNKKILYLALILFLIGIVFLMNNSYAYFEERVDGSCVSLEVGNLTHTLKSEVTVEPRERKKIEVVVSNVDKVESKYQLVYSSSDNLTDVVVGYSPDSTDLPYGDLAKGEEKHVVVTVQNNSEAEKTVYIDVRGGLPNNSVEDIILEEGENRVTEEIEEPKIPISEILKLESKVDTSTTINFSAISSATNGRGIYKYTEDGEDIYYWRGAVTDNHVIFGGYCWEMVRTTKTGGVKMIYDGVTVESNGVQTCPNTGSNSQLSVGNIKFNASYNDNAYVGYMYGLTGVMGEPVSPRCIKLNSVGTAAEVGTETTKETCEQAGGKWATTAYESTHANVVNSNIKREIDEWFRTSSLNTEENLEKIEDAVYCNDRSVAFEYGPGYGTNKTIYNAAARVGEEIPYPQPSLECANVNDRFTTSKENGNGDLTYPVGLLTADEIVLAGGLCGSNNTDYYLNVGSNNYYWTLSPNHFVNSSAYEFYVYPSGSLDYSYVDYTFGARPVVSLAAGTSFASGGDGSEEAPYIVE